MKEYFECHITLLPDADRNWAQGVVEQEGWTFSEIQHDIILGRGPKLYATKHFNLRVGLDRSWELVQEARKAFERQGLKVLRCKVECVMKDERYDG